MSSDTIIALSTPPGVSALALIRISGPQAHELAGRHFGKAPAPRMATHGNLRDTDGKILDDVVLTSWSAPASFTGEHMVEISCHGNMLIVENILQSLIASGARLAEPGEFSRRAFLNGKMDLSQAEGIIDLIHARSERALRAARALQEGKLGRMMLVERENLLQVLSHLEAYIDFPDEDISPDVGESFRSKITQTQKNIRLLLASAREGAMLRQGLNVVISGAPNAGKSSLLNVLLERDRAIVSPIAGTTRDTIEEEIILEGVVIRLIDSAGLRESDDEIEKLGIARTQQALDKADLVLHLVDGSEPVNKPLTVKVPGNVPVITCLTKCDLSPKQDANGKLPISTVSGTGIAELKNEMIRLLRLNETSANLDYIAISVRHETLLREADECLGNALNAIGQNAAPEYVSSDLRQALDACGKIVGEVTNEDILDRLFKNFCIGK
ncbi:MAG: tRNA uridine-5-carboxymethylaminomethyl(34) synthesis GTPase MnmE [Verrucomicrobiales bacterium]|jgi:tRNA modification GTPase|nr:tRNA uridine-5-carboxymethylaminomethyl(34) synthesis GTPase MnmE [Verrucomicrobiales bacterium]